MKAVKMGVLSLEQLLLLVCCLCCVLGLDVSIQSNPTANGTLIQTRPDTSVTLSCVVSGGVGGEELQWYRNKRLVRLNADNKLEQSHLCVEPVTSEDNGATFTCQLKTNATVKASVHLEVAYAPNLNGMEDWVLEEKSSTVLSCYIRAYPPVTVVWMKDGEILDLSSVGFQTSNNGFTAELSMSSINRNQHRGVYTCETFSSVYGARSKSFNITIIDQELEFPLGPTIAGVVVVVLTVLLAVLSRWQKFVKCFK